MRSPILAAAACLALAGCGDDSTGPAGEGTLDVSVTTTGGDIDLDGYELRIDDRIGASLNSNSDASYVVAAGQHTLELIGVAPNCAVTGDARRTVQAVGDQTASVRFSVICKPTGISVGAATFGIDLDASGYQVTVDGVPKGSVAANGRLVISRLEPGEHTVGVQGVAANCTLDGSPTRTLMVTNAEMTPAAYAFTCVANFGVIRVEVSTTGIDPDGQYRAALIAFPGLATQVSTGSGIILQVPGGTHQVRLDDVAANCTVASGATREAVVTIGGPVRDTAAVAFVVECVPDSGTIRVTVTTSGSGTTGPHTVSLWDNDCYYCSAVDSRMTDASGTGTVEFTPRSGSYYVTVTTAEGCSQAGTGNGGPFNVTPGALLETQFEVGCGPPLLRVTAPTSGTSPDTEYSVTLWYTDYWYYDSVAIPLGTLEPGGTLSAEPPFTGWFWVSLDDVAANCTVQVQNPSQGFFLHYGVTVELSFPVTCGP